MVLDPTPKPLNVEGKLAELTSRGISVSRKLEEQIRQLGKKVDKIRTDRANNLQRKIGFYGMLDRMSDMQIQQNTLMALRLTPPDIHAVMRQYAYNTFDFDKAEEIIAQGKRIMTEALEQYERP
jgi:NTE family protein